LRNISFLPSTSAAKFRTEFWQPVCLATIQHHNCCCRCSIAHSAYPVRCCRPISSSVSSRSTSPKHSTWCDMVCWWQKWHRCTFLTTGLRTSSQALPLYEICRIVLDSRWSQGKCYSRFYSGSSFIPCHGSRPTTHYNWEPHFQICGWHILDNSAVNFCTCLNQVLHIKGWAGNDNLKLNCAKNWFLLWAQQQLNSLSYVLSEHRKSDQFKNSWCHHQRLSYCHRTCEYLAMLFFVKRYLRKHNRSEVETVLLCRLQYGGRFMPIGTVHVVEYGVRLMLRLMNS